MPLVFYDFMPGDGIDRYAISVQRTPPGASSRLSRNTNQVPSWVEQSAVARPSSNRRYRARFLERLRIGPEPGSFSRTKPRSCGFGHRPKQSGAPRRIHCARRLSLRSGRRPTSTRAAWALVHFGSNRRYRARFLERPVSSRNLDRSVGRIREAVGRMPPHSTSVARPAGSRTGDTRARFLERPCIEPEPGSFSRTNPRSYRENAPHSKQCGAPRRIRTCDHRLRRPVLYPAELGARRPRLLRPGRGLFPLRPFVSRLAAVRLPPPPPFVAMK